MPANIHKLYLDLEASKDPIVKWGLMMEETFPETRTDSETIWKGAYHAVEEMQDLIDMAISRKTREEKKR